MAVNEYTICGDIQWIDLVKPCRQELDRFREAYGLHTHALNDSMEPAHLPKYERLGDIHFLVIRYHAHSTMDQQPLVHELTDQLSLFLGNRFVLTIRGNPAPFLDQVVRKYIATEQCLSAGGAVTRILWHALETFRNPVSRLGEELEFYEDQLMLRKSSHDQTRSLHTIKRKASVLHKILLLMQEPINHLTVSEEESASLQDMRDQHLKMLTLYAQLLDDAANLMNLQMAFSAQRTNEVVKVLTVFSVFFMPLTFVAGIYGMNFRMMPELDVAWGYPAVLLVMALITYIIYRWFKSRGWLS